MTESSPARQEQGLINLVTGPYFDELEVGQTLPASPAVTLTEGMQALHDAILGNRLRLSRDHHLANRVAGRVLASPGLAWDVSIGQSTTATHHVKANLFYRGLWFHRLPSIGDTLTTATSVEALKQNSPKPGRPATGLAVLRITTADQDGRLILDYRRCAMLPLRKGSPITSRRDELGDVSMVVEEQSSAAVGWALEAFDSTGLGLTSAPLAVGQIFDVDGGDTVTSAPELARLTGNIAKVHHDAVAAGGRRLVYGGHTIGVAMHHVTRAMPGVVTVAGWHGCDHLEPVYEGDVLRSRVEIQALHRTKSGEPAISLRVLTDSRDESGARRPVLDWRPIVVVAEGGW